jgi:hypothetical protein
MTLPGLRQQQRAMQKGHDSEDPFDYDYDDDEDDYTDSSDSDGCAGRRGTICPASELLFS